MVIFKILKYTVRSLILLLILAVVILLITYFSLRANINFERDEELFSIAKSSSVTHFFADAGKAILFYEKLVKNLATPIDLAYIIEDEI